MRRAVTGPDPAGLRGCVIGLIGLATAEEQMLLAAAGPADDPGSPQRWAAVPLVAHNNEFRHQQVQRLAAIRDGRTPPPFAEIDHSSDRVYQGYRALAAAAVAEASRQTAAALTAGLASIPDEDLLDPSRHPWLAGRQLWLQIVVRGFWHPTGHLGGYYLAHGRAGRAVAMARQAVAWAAYLDAPDRARGMAVYNLACAQAGAGQAGDAVATLAEAVALNGALRANAARDADLGTLRDQGRLDGVLASG
jgi:hypothetical protein